MPKYGLVVLLSSLLSTCILYAQSSNFATFKAVHSEIFSLENGYANHCIKEIRMGKAGEIWFIPCESNGIYQLDGYEIRQLVNFDLENMSDSHFSLQGLDSDGRIYGYLQGAEKIRNNLLQSIRLLDSNIPTPFELAKLLLINYLCLTQTPRRS